MLRVWLPRLCGRRDTVACWSIEDGWSWAQSFHLSQEAGLRETDEPSGEVRFAPSERRRFRDPEARRDPAALRSPARIRRPSSSPGRSRVGPRLIRMTSASPWRWRIIRSITAISKARFRKASMARHRAALGSRLLGVRQSEAGFKKGDLIFSSRGDQTASAGCACRSLIPRTQRTSTWRCPSPA